jgi:hypothetical protein
MVMGFGRFGWAQIFGDLSCPSQSRFLELDVHDTMEDSAVGMEKACGWNQPSKIMLLRQVLLWR